MKAIPDSFVMMHNTSVPEILWTTFTGFGVVLTFLLLRKALSDIYYIRDERINHYREFAAHTTVLIFTTLFIIQCTYTIMGIIGMLYPPHATNDFSHIATGMFLITSIMFDVMALITHVRKERLVEMMKEENGYAG